MTRQEFDALAFRYRGAILALPAGVLAFAGRPSAFSIACGLPLAFVGEFIRCWAVGYSGTTTRGDTVTAPMLVTAGPYGYARNPLYTGNVITAFGFAVAFSGRNSAPVRTLLLAGAMGSIVGLYALIVPHEERYLRERFGAAFDAYAAAVPPVLPRFRAEAGDGEYDPAVVGASESRTFITFGVMLVALALRARAA